jgi:hypothetical protein
MENTITTNGFEESAGGAIQLPCSQEAFASFISGLLGEQQEIKRTFSGSFTLGIPDIENFHYLIDQRIREQNQHHLVSFKATILYSDGSSVSVNGLDNLKKYAEIRPLVSSGVSLSWTYLIKFGDNEKPEKQQIDIDIRALANSKMRVFFSKKDGSVFGVDEITSQNTGYISFCIYHTARSWGADIENLLKGHIENFIKDKDGPVRRFSRRNAGRISLLSFLSSMSLLTMAGINLLEVMTSYSIREYMNASSTNNDTMWSISNKVDFIFRTMNSTYSMYAPAITIITIIGSFVISAIMAGYIHGKVEEQEPSFILMSRASEENMKNTLEKYNSRWVKFLIAFTLNISAGILANIIIMYLKI